MSGLFSNGLIRSWLAKMTKGDAALITQGYPEANSKRGTQWEASRMLTGMALNQVATSIIKTGSKTVDLKARVFGYNGEGVIARIYRAPTYTDGTTDGNTIYNMNTIPGKTAVLETQILTGFTLSANGVECGAAIYAIGPASNQAKGSLLTPYGSNRILAANTSYLLTFQSLSADQTVSARLEFYEGGLDLLS